MNGHRRKRDGTTTRQRVTIFVDDAVAIAERCWDAGFEVRVGGPADAGTIVVIDPFDLELEVISSGHFRRLRALRESGRLH